jgi:hypothetical protein
MPARSDDSVLPINTNTPSLTECLELLKYPKLFTMYDNIHCLGYIYASDKTTYARCTESYRIEYLQYKKCVKKYNKSNILPQHLF